MARKFCPACGSQLELDIPDSAKTFICPVCGENVCAHYEPAYSEPEKKGDYLTTALINCDAYAKELGDKYFDEP